MSTTDPVTICVASSIGIVVPSGRRTVTVPRSAATLTVLPVTGAGGPEGGTGEGSVAGGGGGAGGRSAFESACELPLASLAVTRQTMLRPASADASVYVGPLATGAPSRSQA